MAAFVSGRKGGPAPGTGTASPADLAVPLGVWKKGAACLCLGPAVSTRPIPLSLVSVNCCPSSSSPGFSLVCWLPAPGGSLSPQPEQEEFCLPVLAQLRSGTSSVEELGIETRPEPVQPYPFTPGVSPPFLPPPSQAAGPQWWCLSSLH